MNKEEAGKNNGLTSAEREFCKIQIKEIVNGKKAIESLKTNRIKDSEFFHPEHQFIQIMRDVPSYEVGKVAVKNKKCWLDDTKECDGTCAALGENGCRLLNSNLIFNANIGISPLGKDE